jgi:hypothetical protein
MLQKVFKILKFMYFLQRVRKRNKRKNFKNLELWYTEDKKKSTGRKTHAMYKMYVLYSV